MGAIRRRLLSGLYPDNDLGPEHDGVDDDRALHGFCRCGLRNPCNACLPTSAADCLRGPGNDMYLEPIPHGRKGQKWRTRA